MLPTGVWRRLPAYDLPDMLSPADGKGKLEIVIVTVFLPNNLYPLEKETFRSTTHRHRPTSRRLTSISSTALGRCSRFRSRSIMIKKNPNNNIQDMHLLIFNKKEHILFIVTIYSVTLQETKCYCINQLDIVL